MEGIIFSRRFANRNKIYQICLDPLRISYLLRPLFFFSLFKAKASSFLSHVFPAIKTSTLPFSHRFSDLIVQYPFQFTGLIALFSCSWLRSARFYGETCREKLGFLMVRRRVHKSCMFLPLMIATSIGRSSSGCLRSHRVKVSFL